MKHDPVSVALGCVGILAILGLLIMLGALIVWFVCALLFNSGMMP